MLSEEAIQKIKVALAEVEWTSPLDYAAAFDKAIEALEMRIKKKPEMVLGFGNKFYYCPKCKMQLSKNIRPKTLYCIHCGQALDLTKE